MDNKTAIIKGDFHCHTIYSDGCTTLEELVIKAKRSGFDFVSKSDHNTSRGNRRLKTLAERYGLIYIPSVEISSSEGHILGINLEFWDRRNGGKTMQEQIDFILENGGIPVICHPNWRDSLGEKIFKLKRARGFEILNHASPFGSLELLRNSKIKPELYSKFAHYAGSDSHANIAYGHYVNYISSEDSSRDSIIDAMDKMRVKCTGPTLPLGLFLRDGFKNQIYQLKRLII